MGLAVEEPLGAVAGLFTLVLGADLCLRLLPKVPMVILPLLDFLSPLPMFFFFRCEYPVD
jgi:hypothetical protein